MNEKWFSHRIYRSLNALTICSLAGICRLITKIALFLHFFPKFSSLFFLLLLLCECIYIVFEFDGTVLFIIFLRFFLSTLVFFVCVPCYCYWKLWCTVTYDDQLSMQLLFNRYEERRRWKIEKERKN